MLPLLVILISVPLALCQSFENSAIVRTVELGGALVHVTTTYAAKALQPNLKSYTIALGESETSKTSWLEVKIKGQQDALSVTDNGFSEQAGSRLLDVQLPTALSLNSTVNLVLEMVQTHATWPWPPSAAQGDEQALKYQTDLFVLSPYQTNVQRTKVKSPSPNIRSYTTPQNLDPYTLDAPVTKSGATLTYGPYNNIPASATKDFVSKQQNTVLIHYNYDYPVIEVSKLKRSAEISHWGANINIENEIRLRNAGPTLKGQFSRLEHQSQAFYKRAPPHVLPGLTLHLPSDIRNTYFYDLNGNVSTSKLRTPPPATNKLSNKHLHSILELKPRFPLMGGWNYSFTFGWDASLQDSVSWDRKTGKYIAQIPIMTEIPTAIVNEAEVVIILPEGATDVDYSVPFPALSTQMVTHTTYLDTSGRPALVFRYKDLTDKHVKPIYVSYKVPFSAHLKKPIAVATAFFSLFAFAMVARRIDLTIQKKKV